MKDAKKEGIFSDNFMILIAPLVAFLILVGICIYAFIYMYTLTIRRYIYVYIILHNTNYFFSKYA